MKAPENIEKFLKKFYMSEQASLKSDSEKNKQVVEDALSAYRRTLNKRPAVVKQNAWRLIMKSKIRKLAAAVVIIIGMLIGIHYSGGSVDGASLALGQTIENMKEMPWMLVTTKGLQGVVSEQWFGFDSGVLAFKSSRISYYNNEKEGYEYTYEPQQGVIYFSKVQDGIYDFLPSKGSNVPEAGFEITEMVIENLNNDGQKIKQKVVSQNGEKVEVLTATITSIPDEPDGYEVEVRRSIGRNLLLSVKRDYTKTSRKSDINCMFSYPSEGPTSIYDIGVHKDAEIKDVTMSSDIADLIKKLNNIRQQTLTSYVALSIPAETDRLPTSLTDNQPGEYFTNEDHLASLIWRQGDERCHSMGYFSYKDDFPTNERLSENLQSTADIFVAVSASIYQTDERKIHDYKMVDDKPVESVRTGTAEVFGSKIFIEQICWPYIAVLPNVPFQWEISSVTGADDETLIKFERSGHKASSFIYRWFLNPARNYLCQRFEYGSPDQEPLEKIEILDYAQTQSGQWYPRRIQKTENSSINGKEQQQIVSRIIYLQENPDFPDGIFDPESLPKEND